MKNYTIGAVILTALSFATFANAGGDGGVHHQGHHQVQPVISGHVSGHANGGAWGGGTGQNLQTFNQSSALTNGSVSGQNFEPNIAWDATAGFANFGQAMNFGNGPTSAVTRAVGSAGFTVIPPTVISPVVSQHPY